MCDLNVCNLVPVKRNVCMALHFSNERMVNDGNIFNDATIAQSDRDNLVLHASLWLRKQELAPMFGHLLLGCIRIDLTMLRFGTCEGIEDFTMEPV